MPWVRIHDGALRNLKIAALSDAAFRLWVAGLAHAQEHLTDGEIRREHVKMLAAKSTTKVVAELTTPVAANRSALWEITTDGYQIHDFAGWNDTRDVVLSKRAAKRDRIAKWRARRDTPVDALQDAPQDGAPRTTSTPTTTSTPLKNLVAVTQQPRTQPLHGRRNPDLMTYGPIPLWASQFRDEILPLAATHYGGDRDAADGVARQWVGDMDTMNQVGAPTSEAIRGPQKWWREQAGFRWSVSAKSASEVCPRCGNPEGLCADIKVCNRRWLDSQKAQQEA